MPNFVLSEQLNKYSYGTDEMSHREASDFILKRVLESKNGEFICKDTKINPPDFYFPQNIQDPFLSCAWDNFTFEDKIKSVNFFINKYFENTDYTPPRLLLIPDDPKIYDKEIYATYDDRNNTIFLNLNQLKNVSGIQLYSILNHECTHVRDLQDLDNKTISQLYQRFCDKDAPQMPNNRKCIFQLINLPLYGGITDLKTGEKIQIDNNLRNQLLLTKNKFFKFQIGQVRTPDAIQSVYDYEDFFKEIMYYYSPLERHARVSAKMALKKLDDDPRYSQKDEVLRNIELRMEDSLDLFLAHNKKIIGGDFKEVLDTSIRHFYYLDQQTIMQKIYHQDYPYKDDADICHRDFRKIVANAYNNWKFNYKEKEQIE